ncbi:MAG: glycoside hydrolase family 3 protein, partial [Oscillospiraceae bacterium]|nr:glycoside hydrolase family 3 protein [Oscillospiraceae bacterium]
MTLNEAKIKARAIVDQMTPEEKMSQLRFNAPAIERLGIKEYNWWNEAAHGVARAGVATVFPQAIGMAATFDPELTYQVGQVVATESRAKYNKSVQFEDRDIYKGLTFWAPNINIFRDPRWGRGQETYGEDPCLTALISREYIKGIQGDEEFMKAGACAKHFAVHSGPESLRHGFSAEASRRDLAEYYLPAFKDL